MNKLKNVADVGGIMYYYYIRRRREYPWFCSADNKDIYCIFRYKNKETRDSEVKEYKFLRSHKLKYLPKSIPGCSKYWVQYVRWEYEKFEIRKQVKK